jgi:hypothetical protein
MDYLHRHREAREQHRDRGRDASESRRRWQILRMQIRRQQEPCFGTDVRYLCDDVNCPLRRECLALRARHLL